MMAAQIYLYLGSAKKEYSESSQIRCLKTNNLHLYWSFCPSSAR